MTKTIIQLFILIVLLTIAEVGSGLASSFTIQFPPDQTYVDHEAINLVLKTNKGVFDAVIVKVATFEYPPVAVSPENENICFGITLAAGINKISITGLKNKQVKEEHKLQIFYRTELSPEFRKPPKDFERYFFHLDENEAGCRNCHQLNPGLGDLNPESPEKSPCYSCHNNKMNIQYLHMPVSTWTCFDCHELEKDKRKYTVRKPVQDVCYKCHGSDVSGWKSSKFMHGPTAVGQCTLCHDPHGSDWKYFVRSNTTDLCINCHADKGTGKHVLAGFFGKGHPTRGVPDPHTPSKEFSCASCHNPHASDFSKMLPGEGMLICQKCHKM